MAGDDIEVDYTGSSAQVRGGMNAALATTISASCYAIKCLTDPENPPNSGSYRPIKVNAPYGTVLNPMEPAAVIAGNHETAARIVDVMIGALATPYAKSGLRGRQRQLRRAVDRHPHHVDGSIHEMLMVETHGAGQGGNRYGDGVNTRRGSRQYRQYAKRGA